MKALLGIGDKLVQSWARSVVERGSAQREDLTLTLTLTLTLIGGSATTEDITLMLEREGITRWIYIYTYIHTAYHH